MHYLDHTFYLSYQYYQDDTNNGGRGWLLWLLSVEGPLRQAVLTLSALQQHVILPQDDGSSESELLQYHSRAMHGLRQVLTCGRANSLFKSLEERIKFIACGVILISFQVGSDLLCSLLFGGLTSSTGLSRWRNRLAIPSRCNHFSCSRLVTIRS